MNPLRTPNHRDEAGRRPDETQASSGPEQPLCPPDATGSKQTEMDFGRDMRVFGRQPAATKELEVLGDLAEKAIGVENITLTAMIRHQADRLSGETAAKGKPAPESSADFAP